MPSSSALRRSYTMLAPFYDRIVATPTRLVRQRSLAQLDNPQGLPILLCGIGSGLDIPYLPIGAHYVGIDITRAMLKRARQRITNQDVILHLGDVMQLPYPEHSFQVIIMHLILAVVPYPQRALDEAIRVLKSEGKILILDKFLQPNQVAPIRRLLSPLLGKIATRTDVVFAELNLHNLIILSNRPALAKGWFRQITLFKPTVTN